MNIQDFDEDQDDRASTASLGYSLIDPDQIYMDPLRMTTDGGDFDEVTDRGISEKEYVDETKERG